MVTGILFQFELVINIDITCCVILMTTNEGVLIELMRYFYIIAVLLFLSACTNNDWRTASRVPAGIASTPSEDSRAIIEFYAADAFSWRGWFAVHPWIAIKEEEALEYSV